MFLRGKRKFGSLRGNDPNLMILRLKIYRNGGGVYDLNGGLIFLEKKPVIKEKGVKK